MEVALYLRIDHGLAVRNNTVAYLRTLEKIQNNSTIAHCRYL
jgi:hypothetical protein